MAGLERSDVHAALEARRELGPAYEDEIVESLLAKIDRRLAESRQPREHRRPDRAVPIVSLALSIPLTAIAGGTAGLAAIGVVWVALVLVNLAYALRRKGVCYSSIVQLESGR